MQCILERTFAGQTCWKLENASCAINTYTVISSHFQCNESECDEPAGYPEILLAKGCLEKK